MTQHDWLEEQLLVIEKFSAFFDDGRERFLDFKGRAEQTLAECERATADLLKVPASPLRANILQAHATLGMRATAGPQRRFRRFLSGATPVVQRP